MFLNSEGRKGVKIVAFGNLIKNSRSGSYYAMTSGAVTFQAFFIKIV